MVAINAVENITFWPEFSERRTMTVSLLKCCGVDPASEIDHRETNKYANLDCLIVYQRVESSTADDAAKLSALFALRRNCVLATV